MIFKIYENRIKETLIKWKGSCGSSVEMAMQNGCKKERRKHANHKEVILVNDLLCIKHVAGFRNILFNSQNKSLN